MCKYTTYALNIGILNQVPDLGHSGPSHIQCTLRDLAKLKELKSGLSDTRPLFARYIEISKATLNQQN
jgi:hypothetical protein